jgi:hypothetical protein
MGRGLEGVSGHRKLDMYPEGIWSQRGKKFEIIMKGTFYFRVYTTMDSPGNKRSDGSQDFMSKGKTRLVFQSD